MKKLSNTEAELKKSVAYKKKRVTKDTPTQMFSCEYCENFKNSYFEQHLQMTASVLNGFFRTASFWRSYISEQLIEQFISNFY